MSEILSRLLFPIDLSVFFERYWAKDYLHILRQDREFSDWLTIQDIDILLQSEQLPAAYCNVVSGGTPIPIEQWSRSTNSARGHLRTLDTERLLARYLDGATVILNQAHGSIPRLGNACRLLTSELGFRAWTNIYITPPDSEGFARHRDDHEVLILQVSGTKAWTVFPDSGAAFEIQLEPGNLLYLPHSMAHSARAGNAASIHVTLGLRPVYSFDLIEELASVAREVPGFRQPAPHAFSGNGATLDFEAEFAAKLAALLKETTVSRLLERRFQTLLESNAKGWPGRFTDIVNLENISRNTILRLRAGVVFAIKEEGGSLQVCFGGKQVSMPVFFRNCLEKITGEAPFAVEELQGLISNEGKVKLVKSLVRAGLLEVSRI